MKVSVTDEKAAIKTKAAKRGHAFFNDVTVAFKKWVSTSREHRNYAAKQAAVDCDVGGVSSCFDTRRGIVAVLSSDWLYQ